MIGLMKEELFGVGGGRGGLHSAARVHVMLANLCMHIHELLI